MRKILFALLILLAIVGSANADTVFNGSLTNSTGVIATGPWNTGNGFEIGWNVTQSGSTFHYAYHVSGVNDTNLAKNLSHILFQVSPNFTASDIFNVTGATLWYDSPGTYNPGTSNPNMPNSLYSVKFGDFVNPANATIEFDSTRAPIWGDFYTKDGTFKVGNVHYDVTAWNSGFGGVEGAKIGVPDTATAPIPGSLVLLGSGLLGMFAIGVRKSNA